MDISVIGLGYVGLATSLVLSNSGFRIIGVDNKREKLEKLKIGNIPFHEPGLDLILKKNQIKKQIEFTNDYEYAIKNSYMTFVCVDTPLNAKRTIDLTFLKESINSLSKEISKKRKHAVIIKSTVVPGTCDNVIKPILNKKAKGKFHLILNPEFLREGFALCDTLNPDRIVMGVGDNANVTNLQTVYKKIVKKRKLPPMIVTSYVNAELIKYASNAFLATKISFANSIADLCEKISHADIGIVMNGVGLDKRISNSFLNAGVGFGGSCLPKDLQTLISFSDQLEQKSSLLKATMEINRLRPKILLKKAKEKLGSIQGKKISILGLAFKPNTDDIRHAPSLPIIKNLLKENAIISVFDPKAMPNMESIFHKSILYAKSVSDCVKNSDCCIILTEWDIFKKLSPQKIVRHMNKPIIIDGRRIFSNSNTLNIDYYCVGKNFS